MSMSIEEAIKHAEQVYEKKLDERSYALEWHDNEEAKECQKCADEHRQLAEWLSELQERRKQPEIIRCKDCENWDTTWDSAPNYHYCPMMDGSYSGDFYCGKAERRTDADD